MKYNITPEELSALLSVPQEPPCIVECCEICDKPRYEIPEGKQYYGVTRGICDDCKTKIKALIGK